MKYDVVLCECIGNSGLNKAIVTEMAGMLNDDEFYTVEFDADRVEASALGFITRATAEKLQFDYYELGAYIGGVLDEDHEMVHEFDGLKIFIWSNKEGKDK